MTPVCPGLDGAQRRRLGRSGQLSLSLE